MGKLENKVAIITGGSRGIGEAIVRRFAEEGASVAFTYLSSSEKADAICEELSSNFGAFRTEQSEINKVLKRRLRADYSFDQLSSKEYSRYFEDIVKEEGQLTTVRVCGNK